MSKLKPDSENTEERLSDKEEITKNETAANTADTNAVDTSMADANTNAEDTKATDTNAEDTNADSALQESETEKQAQTSETEVQDKSSEEKEPPAASEDEDFFYDDNKAYEARRAARLERRNKLRRRKKRVRIAGGIVVVAAAAIGIGVGFYGEELQTFFSEQQTKITQMAKLFGTRKEKTAQTIAEAEGEAEAENTATPEATPEGESLSKEDKALYRQAKYAANQYDYDKAIALLQGSDTYQTSEKFQHAVKVYQKKKDSCVSWPLDQVTHVFYHTLIKDTSKAFDGDYKTGDYDQVMTTIDEFNQITQSMYDKGYVMVSIYDMATADENGNMNMGEILLPPGKVPFVLSQDDVSYYHYMDGDGCASKLVLDENGEVKNEYVDADGNVLVGDYDLVPLLDSFIKEHPDFSYHGRKGILAMTGYNGVLGYRTDSAYKTGENLQDDQKKFLEDHPDFDYDQDVKDATKVADAMKAEGWEFASHTWGHMNATERSAEDLKTDDEKWKANVAPILGDTDMIIFAFGADIGDWEGYSSDNPKFQYYKSAGYDYFCNVDSSQYFVQITDQYFRQGRRNLDGYRMYYNPDMLSDLFDVSEVWDSSRPTPVPEM